MTNNKFIAKKFKNTESAVTSAKTTDLDSAKWHLWYGDAKKAISNLEVLIKDSEEIKPYNKLKSLKQYIENNQEKIVDYDERDSQGLAY